MKRLPVLFLSSLSAAAALLSWGCGPANPTAGSDATPTPTPFTLERWGGTPQSPVDLGPRECPPGSPYTYENFAAAWIGEQCVGCHSDDRPEGDRQNAPIDVNFNTYTEVRGWAVRMYYRAADDNFENPAVPAPSGPMPPAGGPVQETQAPSRVAFGDWLACNAPRSSWAAQ